MKVTNWVAAVLAMALISSVALADGMIVPVRPEIRVSGQWAVKYHKVKIQVDNQVASVSIDQEFVNLGQGNLEVEYIFPVPPDAAIDSMTLVVNGQELSAKLLKSDEARRIYEDIVRRKKDPALLEYVGFGMVKTSAFPLEPNKPAKVLVTYKTVCKKDHDLVNVWYPLNTEKFSAKPIEEVEVTVDIKSRADVTAVYSPTHDLSVQRKDARNVRASYTAKNVLPTQDFQVYYKEANEAVGATLLSHQPDISKDGYFLMLVSPNPGEAAKNVQAKDVVIVLDHSGSMSEEDKLDQAKSAMRFIVKNLNHDDRFNVIAYSDDVEPFFDKLVPANEKNTAEALDRLDHTDARGGTNIHDALQAALMQVPQQAGRGTTPDGKGFDQPQRPAYIIFLTDGRPTVGKVDEGSIVEDTTKANAVKARIFCFGVGYDVNVRLLDKLVGENRGRSDYVKPKEPIESKVSSFYAKIKNPVMTNLSVNISGVRVRDMYPRQVPDLFEGDQILLVGRYYGDDAQKLHSPDPGVFQTTLVVSGNYEGKQRAFEYPVTINAGGKNWRYDFVEKIWAVRRVGFLLDEIQLHGSNQEIIDELVRLSKDYGIMTPYTSFLADERTALARPEEMRKAADKATKGLGEVSGDAGQRHAMNRQALDETEQTMQPSAPRSSARVGAGGAAATAPAGMALIGNTNRGDYESGKQEQIANVQNVGGQVLYRRGQLWVTPQTAKLDVSKDQARIKMVQRFSPEYFDLVRANSVSENQVIAAQGDNDELLIELRGQVYQIK